MSSHHLVGIELIELEGHVRGGRYRVKKAQV